MTQNKTPISEEISQSFDAYQAFTNTVAIYPPEIGFVYTTLGLNGEAGEIAEKVSAILDRTQLTGIPNDQEVTFKRTKKMISMLAKNGLEAEKLKKSLRKGEVKLPRLPVLSQNEKDALAFEMSDGLWYIAQMAECLGLKLSDIARMNVEKLSSRKSRGTLQGNGDMR